MKKCVHFFLSFFLFVNLSLAENVAVVCRDEAYLKKLGVDGTITSDSQKKIFKLTTDIKVEGGFGKLAHQILFSRPFDLDVEMYREKDQKNSLKHLAFGLINNTTLEWSKLLQPSDKNILYHIHGRYNNGSKFNGKVYKKGEALKDYLDKEKLLTHWQEGSSGQYGFHDGSDGPNLPGSWAMNLDKSNKALEKALNWLLDNNELGHPYFIHAITDRDPLAPAPNLRDHIQHVVRIGSTPPKEGGVDWDKQFNFDWVGRVWASKLRTEK